MGEQRLRVLRQSLKRCCTRSSWLAGTDIVLIGCPPSTVEWTADDTNSISKIHAALPKGHVFSSAERTNSLAPSLRPFQMRWYKSKMPPALASKSGSRGKIQQRCCQGRMASSLSHRQMVVSLTDAVRPQVRTWAPSSATLQRERGTPKRWGNSQAML